MRNRAKKTKPSPPGFLTWQEAATEYDVSIRTLKELAADKAITRYRQHGRWHTLLSREELDKVLAPRPVPA